MIKEDIIRMAREADMQLAWIATVPDTNKMKVLCDFDQVQHFAALVAAAERRACVKVCEELLTIISSGDEHMDGVTDCIVAIRARGEK